MDYENIKRTVHKTAREVKRVSGNFYESSKLSVKISKKEASVEDKFLMIGELVYNSYAHDEPAGDKVHELCESISADYAEIRKMKRKRDIIKSGRKCEVCGCPVSPDAQSCPNCGCEL